MEKIQLHKNEIYDGATKVTLELYLHPASPEISKRRRPAMIVFPGGGYGYTSDREGEPIASAYYAAGYNCFVLRYTCGEKAAVSNPLYDAAAAIAHVRMNASEYVIDPDRIAISGFSAGGHLAAYISTQWHRNDIREKLGIDNELCKPNAAVLGYPVITTNVPTHIDSFNNLLGKDRSTELTKTANLDEHVDDRTCPCFIWATATDEAVPVANSFAFAKALTDKGVFCEFHVFPMGKHSLARCTNETAPDWCTEDYIYPYIERWMEWSLKWLELVLYNGKLRFREI